MTIHLLAPPHSDGLPSPSLAQTREVLWMGLCSCTCDV
jgi:hypothetical protein